VIPLAPPANRTPTVSPVRPADPSQGRDNFGFPSFYVGTFPLTGPPRDLSEGLSSATIVVRHFPVAAEAE
jgi:hypothetical protein